MDLDYADEGWIGIRRTSPASGSAPQLSNGGIVVVPVLSPETGLDSSRSVVYTGPVHHVDAFHFLRFWVVGDQDMNAPLLLTRSAQALVAGGWSMDLRRGVHRMQLDVASIVLGLQPLCRVTHFVRALRHLPSFALHTMDVSRSLGCPRNLKIVHEVRGPSGSRFEGSLYTASRANGRFVLSGLATSKSGSGRKYHRSSSSSYACCYLVNDAAVACEGLSNATQPADSVGRVVIRLLENVDDARIHVFSCSMAGDGAREALLGQMRRLGLLSQSGTDEAAATSLVERHETAWIDLWAAVIDIEPKEEGLTPDEMTRFEGDRFTLRHAMHNLLAVSRTGGIIDLSGASAAGAGEAHLHPALILFRHQASFSRHYADGLADARRVSTGLGLEGAYFPAEWDTVSRRLTPDGGFLLVDGYESSSLLCGLRLFGSAMVVINLWDLYRVTQDLEWLRCEALPIMTAVSDMLCSAAVAYEIQPTYPYYVKYRLVGVTGIDGDQIATDQVLNVASVLAALRSTLQACRTIGVVPLAKWNDVSIGLELPKRSANIVGLDLDSSSSSSPPQIRSLLDVLHPLYSSSMRGPTYGAASLSVTYNLAFWYPNLITDAQPLLDALPLEELRCLKRHRALNALSRAHGLAVASQETPNSITAFESAMRDFFTEFRDEWGAVRLDISPQGDSRLKHADMDLTASLLLTVAQGLAGLAIFGAATDTRLYSSEMGISAASSCVMPPTWARMTIGGVGRGRRGFLTVNRILFPSSGIPYSHISPWSVDALSTANRPVVSAYTNASISGSDLGTVRDTSTHTLYQVNNNTGKVTWGIISGGPSGTELTGQSNTSCTLIVPYLQGTYTIKVEATGANGMVSIADYYIIIVVQNPPVALDDIGYIVVTNPLIALEDTGYTGYMNPAV